MAIFPPSMMRFETQEDVIDYVTRGIAPSRKNFDALMSVVCSTEGEMDVDVSGIDVSPEVKDNAAVLSAIMERCYENKKRNQKIFIGIMTAAGLIIIGLLVRGNKVQKLDDKTVCPLSEVLNNPNARVVYIEDGDIVQVR